MEEIVRKLYCPKLGEVISQYGVKREFGTELGNGWMCIDNISDEDGKWCSQLMYYGQTFEQNSSESEDFGCISSGRSGCNLCDVKDYCGEYEGFLQDSISMLQQIDNNMPLSSLDLEYLVEFNGVETIAGYQRKGKRYYITIVTLGNRFFSISWLKKT